MGIKQDWTCFWNIIKEFQFVDFSAHNTNFLVTLADVVYYFVRIANANLKLVQVFYTVDFSSVCV